MTQGNTSEGSQQLDVVDFVESYNRFQKLCHDINVANGWWEERRKINKILSDHGIDNRPHQLIELFGLLNTEASEAIEDARKRHPDQWGRKEKDSVVWECADAVVRINDLCQEYNLPLAEVILLVLESNKNRGFRHGNKAA
jgi:hypothetical protein